MQLKIYTVYDEKTFAYMQPFFARSKGDAIRSITEAVNDPNKEHTFAKYPEDFILYELGEFNDQDASIQMPLAPVHMGKLLEFSRQLPLFPENTKVA